MRFLNVDLANAAARAAILDLISRDVRSLSDDELHYLASLPLFLYEGAATCAPADGDDELLLWSSFPN